MGSWRASLWCSGLVALLAATVTLACADRHVTPSPSSYATAASTARASPAAVVTIEPVDSTPLAGACDEALGVSRVNQLFWALNHQDDRALAALFPTRDTPWDFEIQPDILIAATSAGATAWASDIDVTSHQDLGRIMAQFAHFHLVFTAPLHGGVVTEKNPGSRDRQVVAIGPVRWRGASPSLTARGKTAVIGGGKTAVDCATGLFTRVLLGPLGYEP